MKIRFSKGNSFSPVSTKAASIRNALTEKRDSSFSPGRTDKVTLPDVQ